jgi:hypothetical protein
LLGRLKSAAYGAASHAAAAGCVRGRLGIFGPIDLGNDLMGCVAEELARARLGDCNDDQDDADPGAVASSTSDA